MRAHCGATARGLLTTCLFYMAGLGVRWGMGHSMGLLLMFSVFRMYGSSIIRDNGPLAFAAQLIVGIFMVGLGLMGCLRYSLMILLAK